MSPSSTGTKDQQRHGGTAMTHKESPEEEISVIPRQGLQFSGGRADQVVWKLPT
jgi:hypothetical protein